MNKNNNWLIWVIAVVAILALILAIIAVNLGITGKSIFSFGAKNSGGNPKQVNTKQVNTNYIQAHSCDADDICEANQIKTTFIDGGVNNLLNLYADIDNPDNTAKIMFSGESVYIYQDVLANRSLVTGSLQVADCKQNGNGTCYPLYACISSCSGKIYSSHTPCV